MRKSKFIVLIALILIIIMALSATLLACDRSGKDDNTNSGDTTNSGDNEGGGSNLPPPPPPGPDSGDEDDDIYYSQNDALNLLFDGIVVPEQAMGIDISAEVVNNEGKIITLLLQGNIYSKTKNELVIAIYSQLTKESEKELEFGYYILNGKSYIDLGKDENGNDTALLYLEDFDMNYLIQIFEKSPEIVGIIGDLIKDLLKENNMSIDFNSIFNVLIQSLFAAPTMEKDADGNIIGFDMELQLRKFVAGISGLLGVIEGLDQLPVDINAFLSDLLEIIPEIGIYMNADFATSGELTNLALSIEDWDSSSNTYEDEIVKINANIQVVDTPLDIEMPNIEEQQISNFSLTNIQFSLDFILGTETDKQVDVGKLINGFLGTNTLPVGVLLLQGGTGLRLDVKLDLDLNYDKSPEDNNLMLIELYMLNQDGSLASAEPQIGIYYVEEYFYLDLDNMLPDYMKGVNLKVHAPLDGLFQGIVAMITGAIDGALGTDFDAGKEGYTLEDNGKISMGNKESVNPGNVMPLLASAKTAGTDVLALTQNTDDGKIYVSPTVQALVQAVANLIGINSNLFADNDSIDVIVNNDLLSAISSLIGKSLPFAFPESMGDIVLSINFADIGLESVKVNTSIESSLNAEIKLHNFLIGYEEVGLKENILSAVNMENTSYLSSLNGVIDKVLGGVTMSSNITLKFNKGTYDLAPFIAGFGVSQLERTELLWEFSDNFVLDAQLTVQIALNRNEPEKSHLVFEIKTTQGVNVGATQIFAPNTVLLGIYGYNNKMYIDISNFKIANITLPKLSFDMNFSQIVYTLIDDQIAKLLSSMNIPGSDLDFDFDLGGLLGLSSVAGSEESEVSMAGEDASTSVSDKEMAAIIFGLNTDEIYASVSLAAIMAILDQTQTELGQTLAEALSLMEVDLSFIMGKKGGFNFNFEGNIMPKLDSEGNAVYYYKDGKRLDSRDSNGNKIYYTKEEYDYKEYYYGVDSNGESIKNLSLVFNAGTPEFPIIVGDIPEDVLYDMEAVIGEFNAYQSDLIQAVVDTVGEATIEATIDLRTYDNAMNITQIINTIMASVGQRLDLPINLNLDDWNSQVKLTVQWDLDFQNTANSALLLTMQYEGKQIFGVYIYRNSLMIDLEGLGLFKLEIVNSSIITSIFGAIDSLVKQIGDFDLNEIIGDLLEQNGLPTVPGIGEPDGEGEVATDGNAPTVGEDVEVMDLIQYIIQAVSLEDTRIIANFSASLVNTLFKELLGMSLGVDISLDADLDLFGNSFNFNVGVEDIEADINMQLSIGDEVNIEIDYDSIPNWDATNGEEFTRTMLDNLNIGFVLDIANYTADTVAMENDDSDTVTDNYRVYTRVIIEKLTSPRTLSNTSSTINVPAGNFLITVAHIDGARYNNSNAGTLTPLVYVILDYTKTSGQLRIVLCKNVINFVVDVGDYVDVAIDLDLVATLAPVFENLFSQIDGAMDGLANASNTESVALAGEEGTTEPTGFEKIFAELDIVALLNGGIDLNLRNNGNFNANISFNPYLINKLIDDVLSLIFGPNTILNLAELAPDMFSENYLAKVNWTREITGSKDDTSSFWGSLRAQIAPILSAVVKNMAGISISSGFIDLLAGGVYYQIRQILAGILPFAVFNEMDAGIEIADATIANIYIQGYDYGQDVYDLNGNVAYANNKSARKDGYFTEIKLYNTSESVGSNPVEGEDGEISYENGIVTWADIPTEISFDPYAYTTIENGVNTLINEYFTGKIASYQKAQELYKSTVTFVMARKEADGSLVADGSTSSFNSDLMSRLNSAGTYYIIASASFNNGVTRTLNITIDAYSKGDGIKSIEPINMHVYDTLPDFITINLNDGTQRKINTQYVTFNDIEPQGITAHTVDASVTFADGTTAPIEINYLDSTVVEINTEGASGKVVTIDLYEFDLNTSTIEDYISDILFFKYADGMSTGLDITSSWDVKEADVLFNRTVDADGFSRDVSGCQFVVTTTIGSGATSQEVQLIFIVHTKQVTKLTMNGLENTLRIDPYRYYLYLTTGDEQFNPFPATATADYYQAYDSIEGEAKVDEYEEEVFIAWGDYSNIDFSWDNDNTTATPISVSLDNSKYPNTSFTWSKQTNVVMLRNEIQAIYFDEELTQSVYYIDPFEYFINEKNGVANYPEKAFVKFSNGSVYELPIAWEIPEDFEVGFANQFTQAKVTIGFDTQAYSTNGTIQALAGINGDLLQSTYVNVRVRDLDPQGILLAGSELMQGTTYYIDPIQVNYYGMNPFPEYVTVQYKTKDNLTTDLPVEWEYTFDVTMYGQKNLVAYACITDDIKYAINVEILDRSLYVEYDLDTVVINPYDYILDEKGNRTYEGYSKTTTLTQKIGDLNLEDFTITGYNAPTSPKSTEYNTYIEYVITYKEMIDGTEQTSTFTSTVLEEVKEFVANKNIVSAVAYENFIVPITWDLSELNYAVADTYIARAIIAQGTKDETQIRVNVEVLDKKVKNVGGENYYYNITVGSDNVTQLVRNMMVYFEDGTSGSYECTIDLSTGISFENFTLEIRTEKNGTVRYFDNMGKELFSTDEIRAQGLDAQVRVCSGDIAQYSTIKVHIVKYTTA